MKAINKLIRKHKDGKSFVKSPLTGKYVQERKELDLQNLDYVRCLHCEQVAEEFEPVRLVDNTFYYYCKLCKKFIFLANPHDAEEGSAKSAIK